LKTRRSFSALGWISAFLFLFAIVLTTLQFVQFSQLRATYPSGMEIAGIPVGGLDRQASAQRLLEAYNIAVELHYGDNVIHLDPAVVGFELDLESMLAAANLERTQQSFWIGFWDYLWGRSAPAANIPLRESHAEDRLRTYLQEEIASRYDQPPTPPIPIAGTVQFQSGNLGTSVDIERAIIPIELALRSTSRRIVSLPLQRTLPPRPSIANLNILLKQTIDLAGFDGLVGFYMLDLQTGDEIHY